MKMLVRKLQNKVQNLVVLRQLVDKFIGYTENYREKRMWRAFILLCWPCMSL